MYRVESVSIAGLKQLKQKESDSPLPEDTNVSGDYRVRYRHTLSLAEAMEHYLNEHVPATWRLIGWHVIDERVTFVWSVD